MTNSLTDKPESLYVAKIKMFASVFSAYLSLRHPTHVFVSTTHARLYCCLGEPQISDKHNEVEQHFSPFVAFAPVLIPQLPTQASEDKHAATYPSLF